MSNSRGSVRQAPQTAPSCTRPGWLCFKVKKVLEAGSG